MCDQGRHVVGTFVSKSCGFESHSHEKSGKWRKDVLKHVPLALVAVLVLAKALGELVFIRFILLPNVVKS